MAVNTLEQAVDTICSFDILHNAVGRDDQVKFLAEVEIGNVKLLRMGTVGWYTGSRKLLPANRNHGRAFVKTSNTRTGFCQRK
jgi:hypothetical protein